MTLYYIRSIKYQSESLVFDVAGHNKSNGTNVILFKNNKGGNQKFKFENGYFIPYFEETKCLTFDTHSNVIIIWDRKNEKENLQKWEFIGGRICSKYNGQFVTCSKLNKRQLILAPRRNQEESLDQMFELVRTQAGFFNKFFSAMSDVKSFVGPAIAKSAQSVEVESEEGNRKKECYFITSDLIDLKIISTTPTQQQVALISINSTTDVTDEPISRQQWRIDHEGYIQNSDGFVLDINTCNNNEKGEHEIVIINNKHTDRKSQRWRRDPNGRILNRFSHKVVSVGLDGCSLHLEFENQQNLSQIFMWKKKNEVQEEINIVRKNFMNRKNKKSLDTIINDSEEIMKKKQVMMTLQGEEEEFNESVLEAELQKFMKEEEEEEQKRRMETVESPFDEKEVVRDVEDI